MVSNFQNKPQPANVDALVRSIGREQQNRKVLFLTDSNTAVCCLPILVNAGLVYQVDQVLIVRAGEQSKSFTNLKRVLNWMTQNKMQRSDLLINLGGGMISDLGGFASSIYMRGIEYMNIPTSLLAMVDAAIGGKTGINFRNFKNYLGTFSNPSHIYICDVFLQTLPAKEWRSGLAEMIKHALLKGDYTWLREIANSGSSRLRNLSLDEIYQSALVKVQIVEGDPQERGERKILNFGHTIGHAVEKVFAESNRKVRHGEAVACGMYIAVRISEHMLGFNPEHSKMVQGLILKYFTKLKFKDADPELIFQACSSDKKNYDAQIQFVLLDTKGVAKFNIPVPPEIIVKELYLYKSL